jgi:hypothetical protein
MTKLQIINIGKCTHTRARTHTLILLNKEKGLIKPLFNYAQCHVNHAH